MDTCPQQLTDQHAPGEHANSYFIIYIIIIIIIYYLHSSLNFWVYRAKMIALHELNAS